MEYNKKQEVNEMDMNVVLIAIILFIPVYLLGIVSNSKLFTTILAVVLLVFVMFIAGEKYIYFDVIGVGVAIIFAFLEINE